MTCLSLVLAVQLELKVDTDDADVMSTDAFEKAHGLHKLHEF